MKGKYDGVLYEQNKLLEQLVGLRNDLETHIPPSILAAKVTLLEESLAQNRKEIVEVSELLTSSSSKIEEFEAYLQKEKYGWSQEEKTCEGRLVEMKKKFDVSLNDNLMPYMLVSKIP